jgi:hypothetical protein
MMRALVLIAALTGCQLVFGPLDQAPADGSTNDVRDDAPDPSCPESYDVAAGASQYRRVLTTLTWAAAEKLCRDDLLGSTHLAVPDDLLELELLASQISPSAAWVGVARDLNTQAIKSAFVEVTGDPADVTLWAVGQPDNAGGRELTAAIQSQSQLADFNFDTTRAFICECDGKPVVKTFTFR